LKKLEQRFLSIQKEIFSVYSKMELSKKTDIIRDPWKRPEGGGGKTCVIQNGNIFDNSAVNFSSIYGSKLPKSALGNSKVKSTRYGFQAMGVSVICHPKNPNIPTSHMINKNKQIKDWWIGGGYDLTPYVIYKDDINNWHSQAKANLDRFDKSFYKSFSKTCNEYFYIPHRNERRGVGGIFFDNKQYKSIDSSINFLESIAKTYLSSYKELINNRKKETFTKEDKQFQEIRRGRYVEFNLVNDRGTAFGLQSNGRISSILSSLPLNASWVYKKTKSMEAREKHSRFARNENISISYEAFKVDENNFNSFIKEFFSHKDSLGLNITLPFKKSAAQLEGKISEEAKIIAAVNTIKKENRSLYLDSTDGVGFIDDLKT